MRWHNYNLSLLFKVAKLLENEVDQLVEELVIVEVLKIMSIRIPILEITILDVFMILIDEGTGEDECMWLVSFNSSHQVF